MSDTLAAVRRAIRSAKSAERRALRHKMNRYNPLASKGKTPDNLYNAESARTTQDVIEETLEAASRKKQSGGRFSVTQTDRLLRECNIVSPEVRAAWHAKIGIHNLMSDEVREKLQLQAGNYQTLCKKLRERRLDELARWMVYQWCDAPGGGYDPDKHPKQPK